MQTGEDIWDGEPGSWCNDIHLDVDERVTSLFAKKNYESLLQRPHSKYQRVQAGGTIRSRDIHTSTQPRDGCFQCLHWDLLYHRFRVSQRLLRTDAANTSRTLSIATR